MLTEGQERFAQEYLVDLNATGAYARAYPKAKRKSCEAAGPRMLGNVRVSARIAELQAVRAARTEVTQDYVITRLRENVERALQTEPVCDREGTPTGEYVYQGAVVNGALALLGKHLGMFVERLQHSGPGGVPLTAPTVVFYAPDNGRGRQLPVVELNGKKAASNGHSTR